MEADLGELMGVEMSGSGPDVNKALDWVKEDAGGFGLKLFLFL